MNEVYTQYNLKISYQSFIVKPVVHLEVELKY